MFLFALAVALIALSAYLVVAFSLHLAAGGAIDVAGEGLAGWRWDPVVFWYTVGGTFLLIGAGSLYKMTVLGAGGGEAVANMFGGTFIQPGTVKKDERRLLNVVEEMALAAGVAVPRVFLIDSESINALAAGQTINGAVIGVTRGCMERLTRQELQGVVAHEFSHIINGDMTSNLRLVGLLHGILLLAIVGRVLLRAAGRAGGGRNSGQARLVLLAVGVGLLAIGYFGVFFGRLIKAAVSRQREFLADATAVQYTRDPEGIHGALRKISESSSGGRVEDPVAEELAHLFFANALSRGAGFLSSHPPIKERLARIMPGGGGRVAAAVRDEGAEAGERRAGGGGILAGLDVGVVERRGMDNAGAWMGMLHPLVEGALRTPRTSCSLLLSILDARIPEDGRAKLNNGKRALPGDIRELASELQAALDTVPRGELLPLADLCLATLKGLPLHDLRDIHSYLSARAGVCVGGDDFLGYMVNAFIRARLEDALPDGQEVAVPGALRHLPDIRVVMSFLARAGHQGDERGAELSYRRAMETFAEERPSVSGAVEFGRICEPESCGLEQFDRSLFALRKTLPDVRRAVAAAAAAGIFSDNEARDAEHELFRALAGVLDFPVPPSLAGRATV